MTTKRLTLNYGFICYINKKQFSYIDQRLNNNVLLKNISLRTNYLVFNIYYVLINSYKIVFLIRRTITIDLFSKGYSARQLKPKIILYGI